MTNQLTTQPEQTKLKTQSAKRIKISFLEEKLSPDFDFQGFKFNRKVKMVELNKALEEIKTKFELGSSTIYELQSSESSFAIASSNLFAAEKNYEKQEVHKVIENIWKLISEANKYELFNFPITKGLIP